MNKAKTNKANNTAKAARAKAKGALPQHHQRQQTKKQNITRKNKKIRRKKTGGGTAAGGRLLHARTRFFGLALLLICTQSLLFAHRSAAQSCPTGADCSSGVVSTWNVSEVTTLQQSECGSPTAAAAAATSSSTFSSCLSCFLFFFDRQTRLTHLPFPSRSSLSVFFFLSSLPFLLFLSLYSWLWVRIPRPLTQLSTRPTSSTSPSGTGTCPK